MHGRIRSTAGLMAAVSAAALVPAAVASNRPDGPATAAAAKPFYDSRAASRPNPSMSRAQSALDRSLGSEGVVDVDPVTGTARAVLRTDRALTASRGGDRGTIAMDYVRAHRAALGLDASDLAGLSAPRMVRGGRGLTVLHYRQLVDGIPAFDNDLRVAVDRYGRVLSVGGAPRHDLAVASTEPGLSARAALDALHRDVGGATPHAASAPAGPQRQTMFGQREMARLVLFGTAAGARLAWHAVGSDGGVGLYDEVIDATSGRLLYRQSLTDAVAPVPATVYANHPSSAPPLAVDLTDYGLDSLAQTLDGKWALTFSDVNGDQILDSGEEIPRDVVNDFQFPFVPFNTNVDCSAALPCSWDPQADVTSWTTNRKQTGVQAYYLVSRFHDHLADPLAVNFTDASGDFRVGGTGGDDPVHVMTDFAAAAGPGGGPSDDNLNNAFFSTPPDGMPPSMFLQLFKDTLSPTPFDFRNAKASDDSFWVWHEYTHGLSNRLVTNADGTGALGSAQGQAIGEATSDWFAADFEDLTGNIPDTLSTPGELDFGGYSDADPHAARTQAIDCPVDSVALACPGGAFTSPGGYTLADYGKVIAFGAEPHADGEIWGETLWDLRQAATVKFGGDDEAASQFAEILISDAMRLSFPEPSMLEMRNAVLLADLADFGGTGHELIWNVFRKRGMGFFAAAADSSDNHPVADFSRPPDPGGGKGSITGVMTDAVTGLPLAGNPVWIGGHEFPADDFLVALTGAGGRYTIPDVPVGTYPKLAAGGPLGYLLSVTRDVPVTTDTATVRDVALDRDWAAAAGGTTVESVSDLNGSTFGCGSLELIDTDQGTGWSPYNPSSALPGNPHNGDPTVVIKLPQTIDVTGFLLDPSNICGDGPSATTRLYRLETSPDGISWQTAVDGTGTNAFTDNDRNRLSPETPAGTTGQGVRYLRLTLLAPLRVDPQCAPSTCSGTDFIDFAELIVLGAGPNVLPAGSLAADHASVVAGGTVAFDASSFTDADSTITGYSWDFDSDGTTDATTAGPTTSHVYPSAGAFTAKVSANDFRGGAGTATRSVTVTAGPAPPAGPTGPAGPPGAAEITPTSRPGVGIVRHGPVGRVMVIVNCTELCAVSGSVTVSADVAGALGLRSRTLRTFDRALTGNGRNVRLLVAIPARVRRAARAAGMRNLSAVATAIAAYPGGVRRASSSRSVALRL